ncbi:zinc finger protein 320-like [Pollicipes pollicipes]|uniref:zinc finger protein 320-like n=1 Tax=Pollicipes pollicipes TaxID=41117 RepID=UPI0018859D7D|nr:zinc finger protein 320-like [Pollicipes pollicipes]
MNKLLKSDPTEGLAPARQLRCAQCGRHFTAVSSYYHHMAMHRGETTCPVCAKVLSHKGNLKHHIRTVHGAWPPFEAKCEECGRVFHAPSTFRGHKAVHRGETVCRLCLKVLSHKGHLKKHMAVVHGVRMLRSEGLAHRCHVCGRTFRAASTYRNHLALHRGETTCHICGRVFGEKGSKKIHVRNIHGQGRL